MKFSFLYPYQSTRGECLNSIKDLHIDKVVRYLFINEKKQKYILGILTDFENNLEIILWRQQLIKDFIKYPKLYDELTRIFNKLDIIFDEHKSLKLLFANFKKDYEVPINLVNEVLPDYADLINEILKQYKELNRILNKYQFASEALNQFKNLVNQKVNNESYQQLSEVLNDIVFSLDYQPIATTIDDKLKVIDSCPLINTRKELKSKKDDQLLVDVNLRTSTVYKLLYASSRIKIIAILDDYYYGLFDWIYNCREELTFIEFAISYHDLCKRMDMNVCYPTFVDDESIHYQKLYDLYLGIKGLEDTYKIINVYPNNCYIKKGEAGKLIIGENNTGKTVYIRSIGIAQVFAQAGLFVPALTADISIKNQLLTFLSSKELNTTAGGRFEKEVSVISNIIDQVDNNSLIIMNEIFQSTSAEAGGDALFNILVYFTKKSTLWLTVTHLREICQRDKEFNKKTQKDFKVLSSSLVDFSYKIIEYYPPK